MAKKPLFSAGSFDDLRSASGETTGTPLRLPLNIIDEDPEQPRTEFDAGELAGLAESIRLRGVLQPIGVRPAEDGRHLLVFGARRLKASKLAGQADIPAVIVPEEQRDLATQVIENQQRANLSNRDLASVVNRLAAEGKKLKEIAAICNLPDYSVSHYRSVDSLPPFLAAKLNDADMRAIYELSNAWKKNPAEIEAAVVGLEGFISVTEARRTIQGVTGKASNSVFLRPTSAPEPERAAAPTLPVPDAPPAPVEEVPLLPEVFDGQDGPAKPPTSTKQVPSDRVSEPTKAPTPATPKAPATGSPVFVMETSDGTRGVLVTHRRAATRGCVLFDVQGDVQELPFTELSPVDAE